MKKWLTLTAVLMAFTGFTTAGFCLDRTTSGNRLSNDASAEASASTDTNASASAATGSLAADFSGKMTATVVSIDPGMRQVTLRDAGSGESRILTVEDNAAPRAIRQGDRVNVMLSPGDGSSASSIIKA